MSAKDRAWAVAFVLFTGCFSAFGQNWIPTSAPITNWQALACSADGTKVVAAFRGGVYTSTNSGNGWKQSSNAPSMLFPSVATSANGDKVVAVSNSNAPAGPSPGPIYLSSDFGVTWTQTTAPIAGWRAVASSADGNKLVAITGGGRIYTSANAGSTWGLTIVPHVDLYSVASSADGRKLVVAVRDPGGIYYPTNRGVLYSSTNSGATWISNSVPNMFWYSIGSSSDGRNLVGVSSGSGESNTVYTSTDSGHTWISNNVPTGRSYAAVTSSSDGDILTQVDFSLSGGVYISTNHGLNWEQADGSVTNWRSLTSSTDGRRLIGAMNGGGIYTWQSSPSPMLNIAPAANGLFISWIVPSMPFVLHETADLKTPNWTAIPMTPILNLTNLHHEVTMPLFGTNRFYRLQRL